MRLLNYFRRTGEIDIRILIRDLPEHVWSSAHLCLTRVPRSDSLFPPDDPGAPFHKHDTLIAIMEGPGPLIQPLTLRTEQPVGFYFAILRVILGRQIRGTFGVQIENFNLSGGAAAVQRATPLRFEGAVTWPVMSDDQLQEYGPLNDLMRGGA